MPHRKTPLIADRFYHIYNRCNDRQSIFFDCENCIYFLRLTREYLVDRNMPEFKLGSIARFLKDGDRIDMHSRFKLVVTK